VIDAIKARGLWPDAGPHHRPRSAGGTATIANDNLGSKRGGQAKQGGGKIVATYDYFDHITGDFLMQVVRYEPKGFSQRRPDPDRPSEWARTVPAECRTLYNAARAYNAKGVVLIVEGEKDVDNLAEIGVVATCNPGGAEKWQDNYNEILRDKDVVLVPDNDPQLRNKSTGALQFHPDGRPRHPGQDHADMVGAALQGIAKSIRILHLPGLPEKGDISDWLEVEGNDKDALLELIDRAPDWAAPVAPAKPFDVEAIINRQEVATESDFPFLCLGYNKGSYYYLPRETQQVVELSAGAHTKNNLLSLADLSFWASNFDTGKRGAFDVDAATNAMMRACAKKGIFSMELLRGRGAWWDDGRIVVHCGDMLYVDKVPHAPSAIRSRYVYEMGQPMRAAIDKPLTVNEAKLYLDHIQRMPFARDLDAVMMAGWTVCAHIGGVLNWRPHVWLVGAKGTGKSYVMDRVVKPLFGPDRCLAVASSTTEAGLRQSLGSDAVPVLFDEAEGQDQTAVARIQRILETVRQSSSETGAKIAKGTTTGSALSFQIRSCFMFASINASIVQQSDRSRITVVELKADRQRYNLEQLNRHGQFLTGDEYAQRYQARAIALAPVIRHNAEIFSMVAAAKLGEQRAGDQCGALLAGAYSLSSDSKVTVEQAEEWLAQFDLAEDKAEVESMSDEQACLQHILQQVVKGVDMSLGKRDLTVGELIDYAMNEVPGDGELSNSLCAQRALGRVGLRLDNTGDGLLVANNSDGLKRLLANTPWSTNWNKVLKRLPGAKAADVTYFGFSGSESRAAWVPLPRH
jgi:putative DNA primase/helicase